MKAYCVPIYADFDSSDLEESLDDTIKCVEKMEIWLKVTPQIFFSGNKGFHLIINYPIYRDPAHIVVRNLIHNLGIYPTLDNNVYTCNRLWRYPNSINSKTGLHKVQLTKHQLLCSSIDNIKQYATTKQKTWQESTDGINVSLLKPAIDAALHKPALPQKSSFPVKLNGCFTNIKTLRPAIGERHDLMFSVITWLKAQGITQCKSLDIVMENEIFAQKDMRAEYTVKYIYAHETFFYGCKGKFSFIKKHCTGVCYG